MQFLGFGRALPAHAVTNDELSLTVDTNDEWIASRTGIRQRYFAENGETNVSLASEAARRALQNAGIAPEEIGLCIVSTFTPDLATPSVSCGVAGALGLPAHAICFDLNAACAGFLYGLHTASGLLHEGEYALVIGSEVISRLLDRTDRNTCVLFGDGAGAAVVCGDQTHPFVFAGGCTPDHRVLFCPTAGGIQMEGREVFRFAAETVPKCIEAVLQKCGKTLDEVDLVVCHQANARIIDHVIRKLHADPAKFYLNVQRYGNTSAASIPLALSELADTGALAGKSVLCVGFGAGLTYGGALLQL